MTVTVVFRCRLPKRRKDGLWRCPEQVTGGPVGRPSKHLPDVPTNRKVSRVLTWVLLGPFPTHEPKFLSQQIAATIVASVGCGLAGLIVIFSLISMQARADGRSGRRGRLQADGCSDLGS